MAANEIRALLGTSSQSFSVGKGTSKTTATSGVSAIDFNKAITINSVAVVTISGSETLTNKTINGDNQTSITNISIASLKTVIDDANKYLVRDGSGVVVSQALDATLVALAALDSTPGLVNQTGADTFGKITLSTNVNLGTSDITVSTQKAVKSYVDTAISGLVGGLTYKGAFDASGGDYDAIVDPRLGWFYKISVGGTIGAVVWEIGDMLIVNKNVTGSPVAADIDKIDNTEAYDIVRLDSVQALTNKTMDGDSNTFVDIGIASLKTVLSDASKFIVRDGSGAVVSTAFPTLVALEGLDSTPGIVVETSADVFTKRTIVGQTNKIAVANGDGVSGNPTLTIGTDIVTLTDSQALSNKTIGQTNTIDILDANFTVSDDATPTKKFQFQLSGVTAGQTRVLTVPDKNGTIAVLSDITGAAGATKTIKFSVGTSSVDSATSIAQNAVILEVRVKVTTPYSEGASLTIKQNSTLVIMTSGEIFEDTAGIYSAAPTADVASAGVVNAVVAGAPGLGAADIYVTYVESFLS